MFIDFTISQTGMIRHWLREKSPGWRRRLAINAFGAVLTGAVAIIVTAVKFSDGAWLVLVLIPILVVIMSFIFRQYEAPGARARRSATRASCPVRTASSGSSSRSTASTARSSRPSTSAGRWRATSARVYVTDDLDAADALRRRWERQLPDVPLVIVESPFRAVISPFVAYLDILDQAWPPDKEAPITIVVLPEYVARHWWDRLLYNQTAKRLKAELVGREHTVIADVPYRRGH